MQQNVDSSSLNSSLQAFDDYPEDMFKHPEPSIGIYEPTYTKHPKFGGECRYGDFNKQKRLGFGAFGEVFEATHKNGEKVALKFFFKNKWETSASSIAAEEYYGHNFPHENKITVFCAMINPDDDEPVLVMEHLDGATLYDWKLSPQFDFFLKVVMDKMLNVLHFLHCHFISHNDVHLANIMVGKDFIKLIDFGKAESGYFIDSIDYPKLIDKVLRKHSRYEDCIALQELFSYIREKMKNAEEECSVGIIDLKKMPYFVEIGDK